MLKHFKTIFAFAALLVFFTACGEHNQPAPNKGKNLDSERIYGESREADPKQLPNQYEDPEGVVNQAKNIYTKMYAPREVRSTRDDYPANSNVAPENANVEVTNAADGATTEDTTTTTQE